MDNIIGMSPFVSGTPKNLILIVLHTTGQSSLCIPLVPLSIFYHSYLQIKISLHRAFPGS